MYDLFGGLFLMHDGKTEAIQTDKVLPVEGFEDPLVAEVNHLIQWSVSSRFHLM